jgi:hypothetical protein
LIGELETVSCPRIQIWLIQQIEAVNFGEKFDNRSIQRWRDQLPQHVRILCPHSHCLALLASLHSYLLPPSFLEATEPTTLAEMLTPLLQCPACDHTITLPTTLICGHTVCSKHVLLTPTEGAASHFEPDTSNTTSSQPTPTQLPSCPILTCYSPSGPRPLRRRDIPSSATSNQSHTDDDPVFHPVIYIPPPNDRLSARFPPPPLAKVKVPHPRIDVTLQRVLDVLARFVDLGVEPVVRRASNASGVLPRKESRTRSTSRSSTSSSIRRIQGGVRKLQLRKSSRSSSPKEPAGVVLRNVPHLSEDASVIPGAFVSSQTLEVDHVPVAQSPPVRHRKDSSHDVNSTSPPSDLPTQASVPIESFKVASEIERLHPEKLAALAEAVLPEVTCDVCYQLFYDPVTTPCQHVRVVVLSQSLSLIHRVDLLLQMFASIFRLRSSLPAMSRGAARLFILS